MAHGYSSMEEKIRKLLKELRHDLVTMHNMGAFDQVAPHITFTVDNKNLIHRIDEALGDRLAEEEPETPIHYGSESQYLGDPDGWKGKPKEGENGSES